MFWYHPGWMFLGMLIWLALMVYFFVLLAGINRSLARIADHLSRKGPEPPRP